MCLSALVLLVKFQSGNSWPTPGMHNLVLSISHQLAYDSPIDVVVPHSGSDVNSSLKSLMRERKATYWSVRHVRGKQTLKWLFAQDESSKPHHFTTPFSLAASHTIPRADSRCCEWCQVCEMLHLFCDCPLYTLNQERWLHRRQEKRSQG